MCCHPSSPWLISNLNLSYLNHAQCVLQWRRSPHQQLLLLILKFPVRRSSKLSAGFSRFVYGYPFALFVALHLILLLFSVVRHTLSFGVDVGCVIRLPFSILLLASHFFLCVSQTPCTRLPIVWVFFQRIEFFGNIGIPAGAKRRLVLS
ncbi:hypothetical protein C8R47DRAFT_516526 [Mycena vitilis]|nr:hypothetical protein C8R47DRAFT_516526 [Mycena vitilis]